MQFNISWAMASAATFHIASITARGAGERAITVLLKLAACHSMHAQDHSGPFKSSTSTLLPVTHIPGSQRRGSMQAFNDVTEGTSRVMKEIMGQFLNQPDQQIQD